MTKPNIYDVARLAKVSHQTVSRVINDSPSLREETRERVQQAMQQLGYVPSAAARALVTARSHMVGILVTDSGFNGPASILHAMQEEARKSGFFAVAASVDPAETDSIKSGLAQLRKLGIEGLIVITPQSDLVSTIDKAISNIPVIYLDSPTGSSKLTATADSYHAARNATRYLIELGHKKLLHVAGPANWFDAVTRRQGFEAECLANEVKPNVIQADWSIAAGFAVGSKLDPSEVTAVFAANDHLALGLLKAFSKRGISVPTDVSVIGFDDIPESEYFDPPLTTLRPNYDEIGRVAMGLMLGQLNSEAVANTAALIPELIIRQSTAKPKRA